MDHPTDKKKKGMGCRISNQLFLTDSATKQDGQSNIEIGVAWLIMARRPRLPTSLHPTQPGIHQLGLAVIAGLLNSVFRTVQIMGQQIPVRSIPHVVLPMKNTNADCEACIRVEDVWMPEIGLGRGRNVARGWLWT